MQEILFRGKRLDNGEWKYGYILGKCVYTTNEASEVIDISSYWMGSTINVNAKTVGQFTGLIDKNGKKIFSGDIVKIDNKYIRYIEYSGECAAFVKFRYIDKLTSEFSGYLGKGYDNYKQTVEVIGNVHDNPELLEGGDKQ